MRPLSSVFILTSLLLSPASLAQQTQITHTISRENGVMVSRSAGVAVRGYDPQKTLVQFKNGVTPRFLPGSGAVRSFPGNARLFLVTNPPGLAVADAVRSYKADSSVDFAEPDFTVSTSATPTDPLWAQQWDMTKIKADVAWTTQTDASDVIVAVVDTGVYFTHPDLAGNIWTNPADGASGYTCIGGSCVAGGVDDHGHGTHVAGTIGAAANNGIGIAGINWRVQIMAIKFLNSSGSGQTSDAVLGFQKILALKQAGHNIRVTNNSWGGGGASQALKDAMAAVEDAGIIDVCAAGNNGANADFSPMYPGAYDNRGIISVAATDSNDVGASFTNYGLSSVDIAAPGVSTLSTVPTITCSLCDPSGYKLLSGTSMATPHVTGVVAALIHQRPALTAVEARDIILDPGSYDTLTDAKARSTSSGGRLNLPKTLANTRLDNPIVLNNFPSVNVGPDVTAAAGSTVSLSATVTDPDAADLAGLRVNWGRSISTGNTWLFGYALNQLFPAPTGTATSFTAPNIMRTATVPYTAAAADNRGGGAAAANFVTVTPMANPGAAPSSSLSVSNLTPAVGETVTVNFTAVDPDGTPVNWDLWNTHISGANGSCCYAGSTASVTYNTAGAYRVRAQAIDRSLNLSERPSAVVRVGGATGTPPLAAAVLDKLSGPVPFTVNIDMSGSTDADGTVKTYYVLCNTGFATGSTSPFSSCTFTRPGSYWIEIQVQDDAGLVDLINYYVVATPSVIAVDTTPPTVSIASPAPGASISGTVTVSANAADDAGGTGIKRVDFYRDGVLIGSDTTAPYSVSLDTMALANGAHNLYASAVDNADNSAASSNVSVIVNNPVPPPAVSITSPVSGANVTRKSKVTIIANATPGAPGVTIARVDFLINGTVVGSDTTSAYTYTWSVPNSVKTYKLQAIAYDSNNASTASAIVTVSAK